MKHVSSRTLALTGVLAALNIVLSRLVSIPIGTSLRISIAHVPLILAGLWLGSFPAAMAGLLGDLIGSALNGYAPNPLITLSSALVGVIPALFLPFIQKGSGIAARYLRILPVLALTMLITSQGLTTLGLSLMYGMPYAATFLTRLPQSICLCLVNSFLTAMLYERVRLPQILPS